MKPLRGVYGAMLAGGAALAIVNGCGETVLVLLDAAEPSAEEGGALGFPPGTTGDGGCSAHPTETEAPCPGDASSPDGGPGAAVDASCETACPAAGGKCVDGGCQISCTTCTGTVCPPGLPCSVTCNGPGSCTGIDCGRASSCQVTCRGSNDCAGVRCVTPSCLVHCEMANACTGAIELGGGAAKLECVGANACAVSLTCCADTCNYACPGAMNCNLGVCCGSSTKTCKGDKPPTTCTAVACSAD